MADKPRHLLAGWAAEILDRDERRELMEAALADQDVFDQLVEEESWRRVLSAPGMRREILAALEDRGLAGWFRRPAARWVLASAAAALLAAVLVPTWRHSLAPGGTGEELVAKGVETGGLTAKVPAGELREISFGLELMTKTGPRPVPENYRWKSGDGFHIRLDTDFPAWIYLFNRAEGDDVYTVVYPTTAAEEAPAEGEIVVPGGEESLVMDETPEDERLVLVVGAAPWPAFEKGRSTVGREELDAALAEAERGLESASWRRSAQKNRVRFRIADPKAEVFFVERLFAE